MGFGQELAAFTRALQPGMSQFAQASAMAKREQKKQAEEDLKRRQQQEAAQYIANTYGLDAQKMPEGLTPQQIMQVAQAEQQAKQREEAQAEEESMRGYLTKALQPYLQQSPESMDALIAASQSGDISQAPLSVLQQTLGGFQQSEAAQAKMQRELAKEQRKYQREEQEYQRRRREGLSDYERKMQIGQRYKTPSTGSWQLKTTTDPLTGEDKAFLYNPKTAEIKQTQLPNPAQQPGQVRPPIGDLIKQFSSQNQLGRYGG